MRKPVYIALILFVFTFPALIASAAESRDLLNQRRMAHKERMAKRKQRYAEIAEAKKSFHSFERGLKAEYNVKSNDMDTEFDLKRVKIEADAQAKKTEIDAENHKAMVLNPMKPDKSPDMNTIEKMIAENNSYMDRIYDLQKTTDTAIHEKRIANEKRKNALLKQRDQLALDKAEALGLLKQYAPILATPIGSGLTKQEEKWNEQEKKNTARINNYNLTIVQNLKREEQIREWKIQNMMADFELEWRENEERHKIDCEAARYRNLIIFSGNNNDTAQQQKYLLKLADLDQKKELIRTKYREIKERNFILREEEEKKMRFK